MWPSSGILIFVRKELDTYNCMIYNGVISGVWTGFWGRSFRAVVFFLGFLTLHLLTQNRLKLSLWPYVCGREASLTSWQTFSLMKYG